MVFISGILDDVKALEFVGYLQLVLMVHWQIEVIELGKFRVFCQDVTSGQAAEIADWLTKKN